MENKTEIIKTNDFSGDKGALIKTSGDTLPIYIPDFTVPEEIVAELKKFPEDVREKLKSNLLESKFWYELAHKPTPPEVIERLAHNDLEYVKEYYVMDEMARLFPGYWNEDMKTWYEGDCKTWITSGSFCFEYLTSGGVKVRKIYGLGACEVQAKKDNAALPSQPDYMAIGSLSVWYKIIGKRLGIARDVYSQEVTINLIRDFEYRLQGIEKYATELLAIANSIVKGSAFRNLLATMPTKEQIVEVNEILDGHKEEIKEQVWGLILKMNNSNEQETLKITNTITQLKEKLCQKTS